MDPVDHRRDLGFERFGGGDIGRDHEIFDHAVRIEPFAQRNLADFAVFAQHHAALGQFEFKRIAVLARRLKRAPCGPQVGQGLIGAAFINPPLGLLIGDNLMNSHDCTGEAP